MKKIAKPLGIVVAALLVLAGGVYVWAARTAQAMLSESYAAHDVEIRVPMPLTDEELSALDEAPPQGEARSVLELERALARGKHLIGARYGCTECHGQDFGGGVMVDDPAIGRLLGPNLTAGKGGVTRGYTTADWDRIIRHGIRKDGKPALMPSEDFVKMSDRELSDIVAYIRSVPSIDREVPPSTLGPVGKILLATSRWRLSAQLVADHDSPHTVEPPQEGETVEFGGHLAKVCTGCHRENFEGGPIAQGPPDWAPARNLTPHEEGLAGWTYAQFERAMRQGTRPDGSPVKEPMTIITPYAANMSATEMKALWMYLSSLPPLPTGK